MRLAVDSLLEPISAEEVCGEDLRYDPKFLELTTMVRGKPESQFSAAEAPDWSAVVERCLELFQRSKDLRVALWLTLALLMLKTGGILGFRDGLLLLKGLIERYWEPCYPRLDPEDNNDPLQRVNLLGSLASPRGSFGDRLQFLARLREAPLIESSQIGRISLLDIERSSAGLPNQKGEMLSEAQVQGALRSTPPESLGEIYGAILVSQRAVQEIDQLLTLAVGDGMAPTFDPLASTLKELQKALAPYAVPGPKAEAPPEQTNTVTGGISGPEGAGLSSSAVRSRQEVVRILDQICDFYHRTEPSSPIPLLLRRARRLVNMDFVQLITDLAPDSLPKITQLAGIREEADKS